MGTNLNQTEAQKEKFSGDKIVEWQTIGGLLRDGRYEQAARCLCDIRILEQGNNPYLNSTLAAAHQICLACRQVHVEVELHQHAHHEASQRELELQQQLNLILELIQQYLERDDLPAPKSHAFDKMKGLEKKAHHMGDGRSWWQRLRNWFKTKSAKTIIQMDSAGPDNVEVGVDAAVAPINPEPHRKKGVPHLTIYCLGSFRVYENDQLIDNWNGLKGQAILKYMVAQKDKPVARDILMDVFWPEVPLESARRNLHQAIYSLRQTLRFYAPEFHHILYENDCYLLNPHMSTWVDCDEFEKRVQQGQFHEAREAVASAMVEYGIAEGLYQGEFLAEDLYDDWIRGRREHTRNLYVDITNRLSKYYLAKEDYTTSLVLCQKLLAQDPCYEEAHRRIMRCYLAQGQRYMAVRQYQVCAEMLEQDLSLNPSAKTTSLYQRLIACS